MVAHVVSRGQARKHQGSSKGSFVPRDLASYAKSQDVAVPAHKPYLTYAERSRFYTCQDRKTLRDSAVRRVRDLEETNDLLQREILQHEEELKGAPSDAVFILATIEHKKALVARNTGEILKIFIQDEERIQRIAELEAQNRRMEKEIVEKQQQWEHNHSQEARIQMSSILLLNREKINNNLADLADLKRNS